ncbi:MAG: UDP-2,4-diacetamido-2,4,6-trideoxy-beta-L-altropyranose hydrolase, partial [Acidimicrobiia bacterium]|nr:UDP-2,4-diacetamido-2,4,6-trideoxy-beta-L-altropyranose hydrolase [Acidimicrobiia bacterium]
SVDMALAAAGSTIWELCAFGVPTVAFCVAENQEVVARRAGEAGLLIDAGDLRNVDADGLASRVCDLAGDPSLRDRLSAHGWSTIDGKGADRVATVVRSGLVQYRPAGLGDTMLLWDWTNDPDTRRVSFHPDPVPLEDHERWLAAKLESPESIIWIASDHRGSPLGQIRVDTSEIDRRVGRLAYSIAKQQRGKGWASAMLVGAVQLCFASDELSRLDAIEALVMEDNEASWRSLAGAGFIRIGDGSDSEHTWRTYRIERSARSR